jgi:hypothetical protein
MAIGIDGFIEQRTEKLFVCDEYKLFFLTGQANGTGRRAYISARSFHTLDDEQQAEMRKNAEPWEPRKSSVEISANQGMLAFRDTVTGTVSNMPWAELDPEVQQRLRGAGNGDPFAKYAGTSTKTGREISVSRPITYKKTITL